MFGWSELTCRSEINFNELDLRIFECVLHSVLK